MYVPKEAKEPRVWQMFLAFNAEHFIFFFSLRVTLIKGGHETSSVSS